MPMRALCSMSLDCFFFFQAEDGIRDKLVTGVQTCALPISEPVRCTAEDHGVTEGVQRRAPAQQFGISDAAGVCCSDEGGRGRLRLAGYAVLSRRPGVGECRMIPCAKNGGRSLSPGVFKAV